MSSSVNTSEKPRKKRARLSIEESHCVVVERQASKSNTKYRCNYCNFEFTGGPQKIRVHLSGRNEHGTRVAKCQNVPEAVRELMLSRRTTGHKSPTSSHTPSTEISPRNPEEEHVIVLARNSSRKAKASNSRYQCRYCSLSFVGGPQKIRVHLTGEIEGSTRAAKCPLVPPDVAQAMILRSNAKTVATATSTKDIPVETSESQPLPSHALLLGNDDSSTTDSLHSVHP